MLFAIWHERLTFVFVREEEGTPSQRDRPFDNFGDAVTLAINKDERTENVSCEEMAKKRTDRDAELTSLVQRSIR